MQGRAVSLSVSALIMLAAASQAAAVDPGQAAGSPATQEASPPNQGDTNTAVSDEALPEITISATRQGTNLQRTPIAITAVTAQQLTDRGITNLGDLSTLVPNSQILPVQGAFGPGVSAYIRGIGSGDTSLGGNPRSPSISMMSTTPCCSPRTLILSIPTTSRYFAALKARSSAATPWPAPSIL